MDNFTSGKSPLSKLQNVKSVIIEEGVTSIGAYAFDGINPDQIIIPSSVKSVSATAFNNCGDACIISSAAEFGTTYKFTETNAADINVPEVVYEFTAPEDGNAESYRFNISGNAVVEINGEEVTLTAPFSKEVKPGSRISVKVNASDNTNTDAVEINVTKITNGDVIELPEIIF